MFTLGAEILPYHDYTLEESLRELGLCFPRQPACGCENVARAQQIHRGRSMIHQLAGRCFM